MVLNYGCKTQGNCLDFYCAFPGTRCWIFHLDIQVFISVCHIKLALEAIKSILYQDGICSSRTRAAPQFAPPPRWEELVKQIAVKARDCHHDKVPKLSDVFYASCQSPSTCLVENVRKKGMEEATAGCCLRVGVWREGAPAAFVAH